MSRSNLPRLSLLALAIGGLSMQAPAATFDMGDFRLQVDSRIDRRAVHAGTRCHF